MNLIQTAGRNKTVLGCCIALSIWASVACGEQRPNVVLIMADDLGYGDLSCYGSESIRTPQLDKLAEQGVRLTSFYAGGTVCTPSRMALLTGSYPPRLGWTGGVIGYRIKGEHGLAPQSLTIAEVFKSEGYATGICGKWHLGDAPEMQPMKQGFDTAFYIKRSNNQTKKLWRGEKLVVDPFDNRLLSEQFTTEAIEFIQANKSRPFFLYIPFTAPHFPAQAHPDWKGKSANDAYGDVVEELDSRVGEILLALKQEGLREKTIVVFTSDNGPEPGQRKWASAKPFRGLKWSSLEGGTRVPCIVCWPKALPAGRKSDALVAAIDLLPTLAHACGMDLPGPDDSPHKRDGVNVWDTFLGKENAFHPRESLLYWSGWARLEAVRDGPWKLYFAEVKEIDGSQNGPVLVHLGDDPAETKNLASKFPERVEAMNQLAEKLAADIEGDTIPLGGTEPTHRNNSALKNLQ